MIRKNIKNLIVLIFTLALPTISFAVDYTLLEPIKEGVKTVSNPETYITSLYWYVIGLTVALSVLMIIIGGLEYTLTWASESKKGEARNRIENAITGLIIALTSYLLLSTLNPKLVTFRFDEAGISCKTTAAPAPTANTTIRSVPDGKGGYTDIGRTPRPEQTIPSDF